MDVRVSPLTVDSAIGDMAAVFLLEGGPADMHPIVQQAVEHGDTKGEANTALVIPAYRTFQAKRLVILGLGKNETLTIERVRKAAALAVQKARELRLASLALIIPSLTFDDTSVAVALTEGAMLANYTFSKHTDPHHEKQRRVQTIELCIGDKNLAVIETAVRRTETIMHGVLSVRDLVNEGSETLHTLHFEKLARDVARKRGLAITVLDENELVAQQLNLLYAVGKGGRMPPRLIVIDYRGDPSSDERIALIGKTIVFDSGGVNLKPSGSIEDMHQDMAGGAIVLAAIDLAAQLKLPLNITAVLAAAENAIGPGSYKPGEVITSHAGKTVEIKNTDAEGRLVLADAITYTIKHANPTAIIDVATLTGAALISLGTHVMPLISNDALLASRIFDAGERVFERVWALPLYDEFKDDIKSDIADIKNTGDGRNAGTIAGGAFIAEFVGTTPWAHLDIAGVTSLEKVRGYWPQGATGIGVRLLVELLSSWGRGVVEDKSGKEVFQH